jgi:hypothetical protein
MSTPSDVKASSVHLWCYGKKFRFDNRSCETAQKARPSNWIVKRGRSWSKWRAVIDSRCRCRIALLAPG